MWNRRSTLEHWADLEPAFTLFDEMRRRFDRVFEDETRRFAQSAPRSAFRAELFDAGEDYVLRAELPGLKAEEVGITLHEGVITLKAERATSAPEGYTAHRQERGGVRLGRAFTLPGQVNPELARAEMTDGVLTVTVAKAAEAKPRAIEITTR